MTDNGHRPFDADVEAKGGYAYTDPVRRSAACANERFTRVIIDSLDLNGKQVVDVGCGDGTYTAELCNGTGVAQLLGIDPARKAVRRARERYEETFPELHFRCGYAADLIAEGRRFDVAIYRGVIHHVGSPAEEISTAMQLADTVFFLEPNGWNPVLKAIERFSAYHREHGERSFLLQRYAEWIEDAGGAVKRAFFFGLVPMFCPDWMMRVGVALEPLVERIPVLRRIGCGQIGILASGKCSCL